VLSGGIANTRRVLAAAAGLTGAGERAWRWRRGCGPGRGRCSGATASTSTPWTTTPPRR
jgi:hypothetical protein